MRRHLLMLTALAVGVTALVTAPSAAEDKKDDEKGFVQLFNGEDLKGWKVHPEGTGTWKVEDKAIVGSGKASHLFSERGDYQNFIYRVEAKINDKGNSGQYFRTKFEGGFPSGYEAQINSTHGDPVKTGSLYPDGRLKLEKGERDKIIVKDILVKPGEWFTQEVTAIGNHIVIKVNGKVTVDWKDPKSTFLKGHFAIQQHDPGSTVSVRKVEVKELPADK
jgi:hypothetical protein